MTFSSLPLWLLVVFLARCTKDLNFLGRYLGYLELVSQAFCAPLICVAKVQTVYGRC